MGEGYVTTGKVPIWNTKTLRLYVCNCTFHQNLCDTKHSFLPHWVLVHLGVAQMRYAVNFQVPFSPQQTNWIWFVTKMTKMLYITKLLWLCIVYIQIYRSFIFSHHNPSKSETCCAVTLWVFGAIPFSLRSRWYVVQQKSCKYIYIYIRSIDHACVYI